MTEAPTRTRDDKGLFLPEIPVLVPSAPDPTPEAPPAFARRLWTAGPGSAQEGIRLPDGQKIRPGRDGAYVLRSPEEYAFVKGALGARGWEENFPPDAPSETCSHCGWTVRSTGALAHHYNNLHPGPRQSAR